MVHYPSTSKRKGRPSLVRALVHYFLIIHHVVYLQIDPTDTYIYNARKQQNLKTELRKLSEALQHLQDKRCRYKVLYKKE